MSISKRKINPEQPPRQNLLEKQQIIDLEKRINLHVGSFLVLSEEGDPQQIAFAHAQARNEYLKFGPEMHKIALKIGGPLTRTIEEYLESIDVLLHCLTNWVDEDKINQYYRKTQKLESELK